MNTFDYDPRLALADAWQRHFPVVARPFAEAASRHGMDEHEVLSWFRGLSAKGLLSRIGAVVRPNSAGASTLAAISVPPQRVDQIAAIISAEPCVNHNYERDHAINLWFVVTAPDPPELANTLWRIATQTGCDVLDLRLIEPYHIDLGFGLVSGRAAGGSISEAARPANEPERQLLGAIEDGLPLVAKPYEAVAKRLGWQEPEVMDRLDTMIAAGIISRFGCVLRHREIGYTANAMAVWDVDDERVAAAGRRLAEHADVTLCYRRNRWPPGWRYNLYAMVHGRDEPSVRAIIERMTGASGLAGAARAILFSRRCFVQRGARFRARSQVIAA